MSKPHRKANSRLSRRLSRTTVTAVAISALVALVVSGCAKELPQTPAAENPKGLESQQAGGSGGDGSDASAPEPSPEPTYTVPEYSSPIDLTAEEVKESEKALLVLKRYIFLSERMMRSGGVIQDDLDEVATDEGLTRIRATGDRIAKSDKRMVGTLELTNYVIFRLEYPNPDDRLESIHIHACMPLSAWTIKRASEDDKPLPNSEVHTMGWELTRAPNDWKVERQYLQEKSCATN